mmetsp:Transcript_9665/g.23789  ORF Transcript_9665/g.23789 Transcript_9665/m.23789 type:complete len:439 (-) Transcript_9665:114-1430(-)|eukprot:CAMPEP_0114496664 /NCGR_PEP_ID=MMETSP0109-20121206/5895_1 /TAXON_ID=29199 /ORGANISM="Chlorarachnion reptans, Strain CCCM449" /LENGTH=438 /DNA_ID=CAMNT_0001673961 /DNA_START=124 /DNA_END=1440 /DNA_ORIENTATION=-
MLKFGRPRKIRRVNPQTPTKESVLKDKNKKLGFCAKKLKDVKENEIVKAVVKQGKENDSKPRTDIRRSSRSRKPTTAYTPPVECKRKRVKKDPTENNVDLCTTCGKKGLLLCCERCPKAFHLKCVGLKALPEGAWLCNECHDKEHDDCCDVCGFGGDLLCCDRCTLVYHTKCVGLDSVPGEDEEWLCPKCTKPAYAPYEGPDNLEILSENFVQYGLCRFKNALTKRQVNSCLELTLDRLHEAFDTVRRLGLEQELIDVGFTTFKTRSRDRYDLRIPEFMTSKFSFLNTKAKWVPLVKQILGNDIKIVHSGVMISLPGSATQPYHMDGPHLSDKKHLPAHILNVFVPLVDLTPEVGPTEFVPTSHLLNNYWDPGVKPMTVNAAQGQCILFDYRIKHRGLGNKSNEKRPVIYITYAKSGFKDVKNFSKKRYKKLPKLSKY